VIGTMGELITVAITIIFYHCMSTEAIVIERTGESDQLVSEIVDENPNTLRTMHRLGRGSCESSRTSTSIRQSLVQDDRVFTEPPQLNPMLGQVNLNPSQQLPNQNQLEALLQQADSDSEGEENMAAENRTLAVEQERTQKNFGGDWKLI